MEVEFQKLSHYVQDISRLESISALLSWDQQTYMPARGASYRAEQLTAVAGLIHQRKTDSCYGEMLSSLSSIAETDPHGKMGATVRVLQREYDKERKKPQRLVQELAKITAEAQQIWVESRQAADFSNFRPSLEKIIELKREEADAVGFAECRYDALLDDYEPEMKTSEVAPILAGLRTELLKIVKRVDASHKRAPTQFLHRPFDLHKQRDFGLRAARAIGFDLDRGRMDVTHHPFCTSLGPNDCRILTRYDEQFFSSAFFGTLHEAGHGIYEQGLPMEWFGLPPGKYASLGVHESQSRLWENQVGRSRSFWAHFFPIARSEFKSSLSDVKLDDWYFAINAVEPSLIRVEADEATYNLHIIVRFELEQELMDGRLAVADLPVAWNERYRDYLGIQPTNDSDGVLQDVHWSAGLFGYFPTYSLGNLYAAQLFEKADSDLGGLESRFAKGHFEPLKNFLREHIHACGQCLNAQDLIQKVTGATINHDALIRHLRQKVDNLYE